MNDRTYVTGEKPANPYLHEKYIFLISDVREEEPTEEGVETWSFLIDQMMTHAEYSAYLRNEIDLAEARAVTASFEAALELIGGN